MGRLGFWGKGVGVMVVCLACTVAQAERRVALVIGNANYVQEKKRLANPVNDAQDMYAKLQTLGFAKADIVYREDLKQRDIDATLAEFEKKLGGDTVALVYYAGHGLALNLDGDKNFQNYLPAVDAKIDDKLQVARQSIAVGDLIRLLRRGRSRVNLVFLDACRDNPFNRSLRGEAVRGMTKENPPAGTWIAYATRPGEVAEDGAGRRNGLFTERLLAHIDTPGITLDDMFRRVASDVVERTKEGQEPWPEGWLSKAFYMVPRDVQPPPPPPPLPGPRIPPLQEGIEIDGSQISIRSGASSSTVLSGEGSSSVVNGNAFQVKNGVLYVNGKPVSGLGPSSRSRVYNILVLSNGDMEIETDGQKISLSSRENIK